MAVFDVLRDARCVAGGLRPRHGRGSVRGLDGCRAPARPSSHRARAVTERLQRLSENRGARRWKTATPTTATVTVTTRGKAMRAPRRVEVQGTLGSSVTSAWRMSSMIWATGLSAITRMIRMGSSTPFSTFPLRLSGKTTAEP
ncbi:MAG: hypothetical protein E6J03_08990 [Chloroflexi bacterium]|nr:MAG: hypothetical protein E6J03_08990 [Chloroflexota bacterium]